MAIAEKNRSQSFIFFGEWVQTVDHLIVIGTEANAAALNRHFGEGRINENRMRPCGTPILSQNCRTKDSRNRDAPFGVNLALNCGHESGHAFLRSTMCIRRRTAPYGILWDSMGFA